LSDRAQELRDRNEAICASHHPAFSLFTAIGGSSNHGQTTFAIGDISGRKLPAACRARSRPEFLSRLTVVLEEADESVLWMELMIESGTIKKEKVELLLSEARQLTAIFTASTGTIRRG
jgi:hypothetical protein